MGVRSGGRLRLRLSDGEEIVLVMSTVQRRGVISSAATEAEAWREDIQAARGSSARRAFLQVAVSKDAPRSSTGCNPKPTHPGCTPMHPRPHA